MRALKDALKQKLMSMKSAGAPVEGEVGEPKKDADGKIQGSDLAPPLRADQGDAGAAPGLAQAIGDAEMGESDEHAELMKILESIGAGAEHPGRGPVGLRERAAEGAKGKLAQMKK